MKRLVLIITAADEETVGEELATVVATHPLTGDSGSDESDEGRIEWRWEDVPDEQ